MNATKILNALLLICLSTSIQASTNEKLLNYFEKVYLDEKNSFIECIELEALPAIDRIYTKCRVTESFNDPMQRLLSATCSFSKCQGWHVWREI